RAPQRLAQRRGTEVRGGHVRQGAEVLADGRAGRGKKKGVGHERMSFWLEGRSEGPTINYKFAGDAHNASRRCPHGRDTVDLPDGAPFVLPMQGPRCCCAPST